MTDYNKLAQRIVAQGVGDKNHADQYYAHFGINREWLTAKQFCNDGRVVLALMEKVRERVAVSGRALLWLDVMREIRRIPLDADFPIAIALACLDALENSNDS